jgi:hypothetical protein
MSSSTETFAEHPYMLNLERIACAAHQLTDDERRELTAWAEEDIEESRSTFDATRWPGWYAVVRRLSH